MRNHNRAFSTWKIPRPTRRCRWAQEPGIALLRSILFGAVLSSLKALLGIWLVFAVSYSWFTPNYSRDDWQKIVFQLSIISIPYLRIASLAKEAWRTVVIGSARVRPGSDYELADALSHASISEEAIYKLDEFYRTRWAGMVLHSRIEGALCWVFALLWVLACLLQHDVLISCSAVVAVGMYLAWSKSNSIREHYAGKLQALGRVSRVS